MRLFGTALALALALANGAFLASAAGAEDIRVCERTPRVTADLTCLFDGDSGWQRGTHWHLDGVDAPEIDAPGAGCRKEQLLGLKALDRMRALLSGGYTVIYRSKRDDSGRMLAKIQLADGRDAATELMSAGLAQALPNTGERWCDP